MGDGNQSHQLKVDAIPPALPQLQQSPPAGFGTRAKAVDVAAHGTQPMATGPLQGPLSPDQNSRLRSALMFLKIGGQGTVVGAAQVGVIPPAEGLIQVNVGIHQARQCQMLGCRLQIKWDRRQQPTLAPAELHGGQTVPGDGEWP